MTEKYLHQKRDIIILLRMRNANMWLCFLGWRFYCVLERSTQKMRHLQDFCRRFCRRFLVILADFSEFFPAFLAVSMYEVELHFKQNATFLSRDIKKCFIYLWKGRKLETSLSSISVIHFQRDAIYWRMQYVLLSQNTLAHGRSDA